MQLWIGLAFPVQLNQFQANLLLRNRITCYEWHQLLMYIINFIYFHRPSVLFLSCILLSNVSLFSWYVRFKGPLWKKKTTTTTTLGLKGPSWFISLIYVFCIIYLVYICMFISISYIVFVIWRCRIKSNQIYAKRNFQELQTISPHVHVCKPVQILNRVGIRIRRVIQNLQNIWPWPIWKYKILGLVSIGSATSIAYFYEM